MSERGVIGSIDGCGPSGVGSNPTAHPISPLEHILGREIPLAQPNLLRPTIELQSPSDTGPVLTTEQRIANNMRVYFENPWPMVEDGCIYTLDQVDLLHPVKTFPNHPWLKAIAETWMYEPLVALYKSRRMTITWLMVFLHLWLAMFREGSAVFFVSDKEEKSDELVRRAEFIYKYIPDEMVLKPKMKPSYCWMEFPGLDSYIHGVAQGARQLAQYTATAVLCDEFAFWQYARETFMASKPTIDGGGKFTCISSPQEGFFKELCFDLIR